MKESSRKGNYEGYGYESAYKAYDVPDDLREYYQEFNLAKIRANSWLRENNIPIQLSFKPDREYDVTRLRSNMSLYVSYVLPTNALYRIGRVKLTNNQIKLKCFRDDILKMTLKQYKKAMRNEITAPALQQAIEDSKLRAEADKAYELAYQSNL